MTQPSPAELNIDLWFQKAEEDELICRSFLKHRDAPPAPCCFCAQQMAEKYLKALLISHSKNFPKIHDLKRLATLIEPYESDIFSSLEDDFNVLNKFYATTRYPGDFPEGFSWHDAEESFNAALRIKEFVLARIEGYQKKQENSGFGLIGILIIVAIIALAGGGVWYFDRLNQYAEQEKTVQDVGQQKIGEAEALKQKAGEYNQEITNAVEGDIQRSGIIFPHEAEKLCGPQPPASCRQGMMLGCRTADKRWDCYTVESKIDTSDWKTYRNEKYGFEVKYPLNFVYREETWGVTLFSSSDEIEF